MTRRTRRSLRMVATQPPDAVIETQASFELSTQSSTATPAIDNVGQGISTGLSSNLTAPQTNLISKFNIF